MHNRTLAASGAAGARAARIAFQSPSRDPSPGRGWMARWYWMTLSCGASSMAALKTLCARQAACLTWAGLSARFFETNTGEYVPFDQVVYHPARWRAGPRALPGIVNGSSSTMGAGSIQPNGACSACCRHGADFGVAFTVEPYLAPRPSGTLRVIDRNTGRCRVADPSSWTVARRATVAAPGVVPRCAGRGRRSARCLDLADARALPGEDAGRVVPPRRMARTIVASGQAKSGRRHRDRHRGASRGCARLGKAIGVRAAGCNTSPPDGAYVATLRQDEGTMFVYVDTYRRRRSRAGPGKVPARSIARRGTARG